MDRISAARARIEAAKSVALKARDAGPPCSNCRFQTLLGMCGNPAYAEPSFQPAKGAYSEAFSTPVALARADDGLCGPEALLFEPQIAPIAAGTAVAKGAWLVFRVATIGTAAAVFLGWLLS